MQNYSIVIFTAAIILATVSTLSNSNPVSGYGAVEAESEQHESAATPAEPEIDSGIKSESATTPEKEDECKEGSSTPGPTGASLPLNSKYKRSAARFGSGKRKCIRFG